MQDREFIYSLSKLARGKQYEIIDGACNEILGLCFKTAAKQELSFTVNPKIEWLEYGKEIRGELAGKGLSVRITPGKQNKTGKWTKIPIWEISGW